MNSGVAQRQPRPRTGRGATALGGRPGRHRRRAMGDAARAARVFAEAAFSVAVLGRYEPTRPGAPTPGADGTRLRAHRA